MSEQTVTLEVQGMSCDGCARSVRRSLLRSEGIGRALVDWRTGLAEILFDPTKTSIERILLNPAFRDAGPQSFSAVKCAAPHR